MRNTRGGFGQLNKRSAPSHIDRPRVDRAIGELLRVATRVGVSGDDLMHMLSAGVSISEILAILKEKAQGRSH
jgi:hypothetical protein